MVIAAVIIVFLVLTLPELAPIVWKGQLRQAASQIQETLHQARLEALTRRRCVRFRIENGRTLLLERLNSLDCDGDPGRAPRTPSSGETLWQEIERIELESVIIAGLSHEQVPKPTRARAGPPGTGQTELRFRPSGTLLTLGYGVTSTLGYEAAFGVDLGHRQLSPAARLFVRVESSGPLCVRPFAERSKPCPPLRLASKTAADPGVTAPEQESATRGGQ